MTQHAIHINIFMAVSVHIKHIGTMKKMHLDEREFHLILKSPHSSLCNALEIMIRT